VVAYGLDTIDPEQDIKLNLIEAAERVLPASPERLSKTTHALLTKLGVRVHTSARVAEMMPNGVRSADGQTIPVDLVWAAGVEVRGFLKEIDWLETNRINQLVVQSSLQTTRDENIFALGDCAAWHGPKRADLLRRGHRQRTRRGRTPLYRS